MPVRLHSHTYRAFARIDTDLVPGPRIDRVPIEIAELQVPKGNVEKERLQGSVLFCREQFPTQRRQKQLSTLCSYELRSLREDANEMQR